MSYNSGALLVEVASAKELTDCTFEIYVFDFMKGRYSSEARIKQVISSIHISQDSGVYRFKYSVPGNTKLKCVISDNAGNQIVAKERFVGDRYIVRMEMQRSEIGNLFVIKSDANISKNMLFYRIPGSKTKIHLPDNIVAGNSLMFTIKDQNFKPRLEAYPEFAECFNIEV